MKWSSMVLTLRYQNFSAQLPLDQFSDLIFFRKKEFLSQLYLSNLKNLPLYFKV